MDGVINFFKPRGMTSHDAVYFFRRLLKTKKIGHTGTLDPNATGVLPICIGKGTRVSEYLLEVDKEYIGEVTLGISTDTQDLDGIIVHTSDKIVSEDEIINAFNNYRGTINQTPPMYSALKYNGKKLYELAREGLTVERKSREVTIKDLNILNNFNNREIIFYTRCSRGTYIRTLCEDIGNDLGTFGFMSYLIRTGVGSFKIENAFSMEYLSSLTIPEVRNHITPMDKAVGHLNKLNVDEKLFSRLINGVVLSVGDNFKDRANIPLRVYSGKRFVGIGKIIERENNLFIKMDKVLIGD